MNNIAIIPARSGSKGLKDKNIKLLDGKPLLWYSVQAALRSQCFDTVMVSTDSEKYAEIAKKCGAEVPFLRSKLTSTDNSSSWESVREVLKKYERMNITFKNVMLLQPTSPFRTAEDITKSFEIMKKRNAHSVVGVCEVDHSPLWSNTLSDDRCLKNFIKPEIQNMEGRQNLPVYYRINGAIYLTKATESVGEDLYSELSYAYVMPRSRSIDIDTEFDFEMAEFILTKYKINLIYHSDHYSIIK